MYQEKFGFGYNYISSIFYNYHIFEIITYFTSLNKPKKIRYEPNSVRFKQLKNFARPLKLLYPELPLIPSTYLRRRCYKQALELVTSTENEFSMDDNFYRQRNR